MNPMFDERFIHQYLDGLMLPAEIEVFEGRLKKERVLLAALNAEKRARGIKVEPEKLHEDKEEAELSTMKKPVVWGAVLIIVFLLAVAMLYGFLGEN